MDKYSRVAIILSIISFIPLLMIVNKIFKDIIGVDIFETGQRVLGKPIFIFFLIVYLIFYVGISAYIARVTAYFISAGL